MRRVSLGTTVAQIQLARIVAPSCLRWCPTVATIRERVGKDGTRRFHAQVRMVGYPARTASFPTRRMAERWATTVEADMIESRHFTSVSARRRTLADAIDRYVTNELPKKRSRGMHDAALAWWKLELGHLKLGVITPSVVAAARDKLAKSSYQRAPVDATKKPARQYRRTPSTVNRYLEVGSGLFTTARKEWHWVESNPFESVSKLSKSAGRIRHLSDDERKALLAATAKDATLHLFVLVALTTAARAGELQKLAWPDVDLNRGDLLFRDTKNGEPRTVSVHGEALRLLTALPNRTGLVFTGTKGARYAYRKPFLAAVKAAGLENFRFHDVRHSAATMLAQAGATEQQLRAIGGWKSGVVSRYVHLAAKDARTALRRLADRVDE